MKNKNPYHKLDVRYIGTQDISAEQLEKGMKTTEKYFQTLKSGKKNFLKGKDQTAKKQKI